MAQQNKMQEAENRTDSNLLEISDGAKENQVLEINKQMENVQSSIEKLNKKLNATNRQVKSEVDRLTFSDSEITEKVSETYKQLGALDAQFKTLTDDSNGIKTDLKDVNKAVKDLNKTSSEALQTAIDTQTAVNDDFRASQEDLVKRAGSLTKKATALSKKIDKSIKDNSKALTELESRIVTELKSIAESSEDRDSQLGERIDSADSEIKSQKAKILLMQGVDEALEKRATALEKTSRQLLDDSSMLKDETRMLKSLTAKLGKDITALEDHTARLAEENRLQQGEIETLQDKSESLGRSLLALSRLEKRHFITLGSASLLLLLAIIALYFYGQYQRDIDATVEAKKDQVVDQQLSSLQNNIEDEQMASHVFFDKISALNNKVSEMNQQIEGMNDQVDSLDGRIQYLAPLYNFGSDNTIHGSAWIEKLDPQKASILIGHFADKHELYEVAQRYSRYFTMDLAYLGSSDSEQQKYMLIYGGQFETEQDASEAMRRMPGYMNYQALSTIGNEEVLKLAKQ